MNLIDKSIGPLDEVSEAFYISSQSLMLFVFDVRLEIVRVDIKKKKQIDVTYDRAKDTLYAEILPARPARIDGFEFDFYIRYDWDKPSEIVGFEWLDFSKRYQGIDHIDEIVSVDTKFDIKNTRLTNLSLREVLCLIGRTKHSFRKWSFWMSF